MRKWVRKNCKITLLYAWNLQRLKYLILIHKLESNCNQAYNDNNYGNGRILLTAQWYYRYNGISLYDFYAYQNDIMDKTT